MIAAVGEAASSRLGNQLGVAVLLGTVLGLGLWSLAAAAPALSRPRLVDRIAPQLVDVSEAARQHANRRRLDPVPALGRLLAPAVGSTGRLLAALLGGGPDIERRLRQAGSRHSLDRYRAEQGAWALAGLGLGVLLAALALRESATNLLAALVLPPMTALAAAAVRDLLLRRAAAARLRRIASEYPTVLEFLSLSLAAGEGVFDALVRVSRLGRGELAAELADVVVRVRAGVPLAVALRATGRDLGWVPLERTVDHVITAIERGAPLVEVLRAQARDARELAKRDLLEQSGRKEVVMMVPLVALVLPITVLFAVFPSYFVLTSTF